MFLGGGGSGIFAGGGRGIIHDAGSTNFLGGGMNEILLTPESFEPGLRNSDPCRKC